MDFLSTTEFQSKLHPEVKVTIRIVTIGRRMEYRRKEAAAAGDDFEWRVQQRMLWEVLIKDFEGVTVDGKKPSIMDFFLNGPQDLVDEISLELVRHITPVEPTESADERIITTAKQEIVEAEARIAARKNSEPQSSGTSLDPGTLTAANANPTDPSGSDEIAMAAPI